MAQLDRSKATLRIMGDALLPDVITRSLGCEPTGAQSKGEELIGKTTGQVRVAKSGMWRLEAASREPEDLDGQIDELLSKLTADLDVWTQISNAFKIDLFCGLFMKLGNEGLSISPKQLAALGERGIELGLDIYDASP
jgi:Domain of unknown function (DUF4279)